MFVDPRVTDVATSGLHGMQMGDRALTCRRAHTGQQRAEMGLAPVGAAAGMPPPVFGGQQARVVKLTHAGEPGAARDGAGQGGAGRGSL